MQTHPKNSIKTRCYVILQGRLLSKRKAMDEGRASQRLIDGMENLKARFRVKVEHPFRVIKLQFGFA